MSTLMPETRTWEKQGVTIEYLCFDTLFTHKIYKVLRDKLAYAAPTEDDPERMEIPTSALMFYQAMPLIVSVRLIDGAPLWGHILKEAVESADWLVDPVADLRRIERRAPDNLLVDCYEGFKETREKAYAAPPELQTPAPIKPDPDPETGEVDQAALNFTESSTNDGGTSSNVKVLHGRGKRSNVPQQAAT